MGGRSRSKSKERGAKGGRSLSPKDRKQKEKQVASPKSKAKASSSRFDDDDDDKKPILQRKAVKKTKKPRADDVSDEDSEQEGDTEVKMKGHEDGSEDSEPDNNDDVSDDDATDEPTTGKAFSDDNAKWLKLASKKKSQLMSSDEEEEGDDDDDEMLITQDDDGDSGGDNDSESDGDEELEIERQARLLDAEKELEEEEAEEEMRDMVLRNTEIYHLPTKEELESDVDRVIPPSEIRSHIESILEVLAEFKQRREPGRPRSDYMEALAAFMAELFGYLPELIEYFLTMLSPPEALEFVEYSDKPRPMVVRTNTLKTRRKDLAMALMKRGVSLDPLAQWSKVGLKIIESPVPVGATPEYLSGHYMLQSAASMCPILALSPQPKERILDMSAAPGGKTSYISQLMRNTGVVFANDLRPDRQKATVANMHRLGVKNVIACIHDGRKIGHHFKQFRFDRVLLDAPCSGLGVISRDPSVKVQRTIADVNKCAHLQKELLLAAIDVLNPKSKTGGIMVYSTCSVSVAENEEVVNYALQKRDIKIIDAGLEFGRPGFTRYQNRRFHPSVALTRRFYPHVHNMDGFYVCKIQKLSDRRPEDEKKKKNKVEGETDSEEEAEDAAEQSAAAKARKEESKKTADPFKKRKPGRLGKKKRKNVDRGDVPSTKKNRGEMSLPPSATNKNKSSNKKLNAKMTKPRRKKDGF